MPAQKSFHYVELGAVSIERAAAFYLAVFGWEFEAPPEEHLQRDVHYFVGAPEVGLRRLDALPADGAIRPAVSVTSISETLARVEEAGGAVVQRAEDAGDGYTGFLRDTEGNLIGLWEDKLPETAS